jgi:uncharacterized membrane protein
METLKSKSFVSSIVMTLVMVLVSVVPQLESVQAELITAFTTIAIALVIGHKSKDTIIAVGGGKTVETPVEEVQLEDVKSV